MNTLEVRESPGRPPRTSQAKADTGLESQPEAPDLDALAYGLRSTEELAAANTLYYVRQWPEQRRQGRALLRILRLIKSSLAPTPALSFQVSSLKERKRDEYAEFSDRFKYLIIASPALATHSPPMPPHSHPDKDANPPLHLRFLAPKLFLWAGATSLAFISQLSTPAFKSLPPIFFAGFIISLQAVQRSPAETQQARRAALLREVEALLSDTTALDTAMEEAWSLIAAAEADYAHNRLSKVQIPDPLLMPIFEPSRRYEYEQPPGDPLVDLRQVLYQVCQQAIKIYERAAEDLASYTSPEELPSLIEMYAHDPTPPSASPHIGDSGDRTMELSQMCDWPRTGRMKERPLSVQSLPILSANKARNRHSWSSLVPQSPPPAVRASPQTRAQRRQSMKPPHMPLVDLSINAGVGARNRMSQPLLSSPFKPSASRPSTPSSPRPLSLLEQQHEYSRRHSRFSISSDVSNQSHMFRQTPSPVQAPVDNDPFAASNLQRSVDSAQRARRRFLCHCLALRTRELFKDVNVLDNVLALVGGLKEAVLFTSQEINTSLRGAKDQREGSRLPGAWSSPFPTPDVDDVPSGPTLRTKKRESMQSARDFFLRQQRQQQDGFAPLLPIEQRRQKEFQAYQQKTWQMGQDLRQIATKLNDTAEALRVRMLAGRGDPSVIPEEDDLDALLGLHDSIRSDLESLCKAWEASRVELRHFVDRPQRPGGRSVGSQFSDGLPSSILSPETASTPLASAFSAADQSMMDSELTTPDHSIMGDYEEIDKDVFGVGEEIFEAVSGKHVEPSGTKLSRAERIEKMRQAREERKEDVIFNAHLLTELKDVISVLKQAKKPAGQL